MALITNLGCDVVRRAAERVSLLVIDDVFLAHAKVRNLSQSIQT